MLYLFIVSSVEVQHDNRDAPGEVSWAQNMTVYVGDVVVDLMQGSLVRVRLLHAG